MSLTFACVHCGTSFTIDDKFAGKKGRCKQCGAVMPIPGVPAPRRPSAPDPVQAPEVDPYGFDDRPGPARSDLPAGIEEVETGPAVSPRPRSRSAALYDAPRPKTKGSPGKGSFPTALRVALGVFIGLGGVGFFGRMVVRNLVGASTRGDLETILQERIRLNQQLATLLAGIDDVPEAQAASTRANQTLREIAANLRKLKAAKARQEDVDSLKRQYQTSQERVEKDLIREMVRVASVAVLWQALDVRAAIEELDREEKSLSGRPQAQAPPMPPPPRLNPGPPPGANRQPAAGRPRAGSRKGQARPDLGGPP